MNRSHSTVVVCAPNSSQAVRSKRVIEHKIYAFKAKKAMAAQKLKVEERPAEKVILPRFPPQNICFLSNDVVDPIKMRFQITFIAMSFRPYCVRGFVCDEQAQSSGFPAPATCPVKNSTE